MMIANALGIPMTPWTGWILNLVLSVIGVVLIRNLIWFTWARVRKNLSSVGLHVDLILALAVFYSLLGAMPIQIIDYQQVYFLLRVFLLILILRQIDFVFSAAITSKEFFANLVKPAQERWIFAIRCFLVICFVMTFGEQYLPVSLLNSWTFLIFVGLFAISICPVSKDIFLGWSLVQSAKLSEGQTLRFKQGSATGSGIIKEITWTHALVESPDSAEKIRVRWSDVYL